MADKRITALTETTDPTSGFFVIDKGGAEALKIAADNIFGSSSDITIPGAVSASSMQTVFFVASNPGTYTLPLLSGLSALNFTTQIKNLSGGDITVVTTSPDTFDTGELAKTSIIIPYGYTLSLFAKSEGYLITNNV